MECDMRELGRTQQRNNQTMSTLCAHQKHPSICPVCRNRPDEATERLAHAEILLSDLASGYWRAVLNDQDPSGEGLMGERVAQYQAQLPTTKP